MIRPVLLEEQFSTCRGHDKDHYFISLREGIHLFVEGKIDSMSIPLRFLKTKNINGYQIWKDGAKQSKGSRGI